MSGLGGAVVDTGARTGQLKGMGAEDLPADQYLPNHRNHQAFGIRRRELDAVVGRNRWIRWGTTWIDSPGTRPRFGWQSFVQFDDSKPGGAVDGDEQVQLALLDPHLGDVE